MNHRAWTALLPLTALIISAACGSPGDAASAAPIVRDSAGVTIVENTTPIWAGGEEWRLSDAPVAQIGTLDGPAEYQLHQVADGIVLDDGRIVVLNRGTAELRIYSADGRHVSTSGRQGGGPGEFMRPVSVDLFRDSLHVYDQGSQRMSVLVMDGTYVRSYTIGPDAPALFRPIGRFADGTLVYGGLHLPRPEDAPPDGVVEQRMVYLRLSESGEFVDTLGTFPGPTQVVGTQGTPGSVRITITNVTFSPNPTLAVAGDRYVQAPADRYELAFYAADGTLERLVRRAYAPEPVTDEHLRIITEERQSRAPPGVAIADALSLPHADYFPAYADITLDAVGNTWVAGYRLPGQEGGRVMEIFNSEGTYLGTVHLPEGFAPVEIGDDYMLGVWEDELEVEHVQLYELIKP